MLAPFFECLILVGIHSYLGLHVIRRRIIFVDLALAQVAALGATIGFLFGIQPGTSGCFMFSLTFCLLGAAIFSLTRMKNDRVPQEAVIGLSYAIIAALSIIVIHKTKGAEHLEDILVGSLLWVPWSDVIMAAIAYTAVGIVHYIFRREFMLISDQPEEAYRRGMSVRFWDFLFYATFGFVITFSVRVAGVLLVFVFLVAPAILAVMVTQRFSMQLLVGWLAGTLVTVAGLYFSYVLDVPSGPAVVSLYGLMLILVAAALAVWRSPQRLRAFGRATLGALGVAALGIGIFYEGKFLASKSEGLSHAHAAHPQLLNPSQQPRAQTSLGATPNGASEEAKHDPEAQLAAVRQAMEKKDGRRAGQLLFALLALEDLPLFYRQEAIELLKTHTGQDFGFSSEQSSPQNQMALKSLRRWLSNRGT
jgi:zinc/manganese transport system permease protein